MTPIYGGDCPNCGEYIGSVEPEDRKFDEDWEEDESYEDEEDEEWDDEDDADDDYS